MSPSFARSYPFRIGKATTKFVTHSGRNVLSMVRRNPRMALATFGLILVGGQLNQRRLRTQAVAVVRKVIDAAGIYLDNQGEAHLKPSDGVRREPAQQGQRRTQTRQGARVIKSGPSSVETKSRTKTRHQQTEMGGGTKVGSSIHTGCVPPKLGRHRVERTREALQASPSSSIASSSPARGAGDDSSCLSNDGRSTPDSEMDNSVSSTPGVTREQAKRRRDLQAKHAKYTARLSRREASLAEYDTEWLEADETSKEALEASDQAQAVLKQAQAAVHEAGEEYHLCREKLVKAERKVEKARFSRDLANDNIEAVEREQEELEMIIYVDWE